MYPVARHKMLSPLRRPTLARCSRSLLQKSYATESTPKSSDTGSQPTSPRFYSPTHRNQLFVRCKSDHVHSMPEYLAMLRGVEREVGKLKDYQFNRDPYVNERYEKWFCVRLEDNSNWERVPESGKTLHVEVPLIRDYRLGGFGISDVQDLLLPEDRVEDDVGLHSATVAEPSVGKPAPKTRRVELRIERSIAWENEKATYVVTKDRRAKIGQQFVSWGGFYQPAGSALDVKGESKTIRMLKLKERYGTVQDEPAVEPKEEAQVQSVEIEPEVVAEVEVAATSAEPVPDPTESPEVSAQPIPSPPSPSQPQATKPPASAQARRRERLLQLARKNAQMPLPPSVRYKKPDVEPPKPEEVLEKEREEKREEKRKEREATRQRVWKLMGGWFP
ncbi:hypothetical protein BC835DRAFT_591305 [Cytidiella melzeri]|nr:hypothetical protein BC835DRAFT_591305 [Cytidiella melzeri]